ncbi:MAG: hypothetical protein GX683_04815 [Ruminococcaceae bacterium]|jgi:hypothetical protein|nr:hypothetical protein [Oscillospiraceae bacterium]
MDEQIYNADAGAAMITDELYLRQIELMKTMLEHGALTPAQYEYSRSELTRKWKTTNSPADLNKP